MANLQFLSKLNPIRKGPNGLAVHWSNLAFLGAAAALSRLMVAVTRTWLNRPTRRDVHPEYSKRDRFSGFMERAFVELVGTGAYMGTIYGTLDLYANKAEKYWLKSPVLKDSDLPDKLKAESDLIQQLNKKMHTFFNTTTNQEYKGKPEGKNFLGKLFHEVFDNKYNQRLEKLQFNETELKKHTNLDKFFTENPLIKDVKNILNKANLNVAEKNKALETVAKLGKQYVGKIKKHTVKMWSSAVLAGTIMGGVIIQLANDRLWTEHAVPKIADWFGYKRNPEKVVTTLTSPLAPSLSLTPSLDLSSGVANSSGALLAPPALKDFSVSPISIPQPFKAQPHLYNQFTRPQSTQPMPHTQYAGMGLRI